MSSLRIHRAIQDTTSASGILLTLRLAGKHLSVPRAVVNSHLSALGSALRRLESLIPEPPPPPPPPPVVVPARHIIVVEPIVRANRDPALVQQDINGCKALLLEIIRRAAYDWVLYRESTRLQQKKLAEEAYVWLFEERSDHPDWMERMLADKDMTSFFAICEALDLDPRAVRDHVQVLTPRHVMNVGRPAEYRRHDYSVVESQVHTPKEHNIEYVSLESLEEEQETSGY